MLHRREFPDPQVWWDVRAGVHCSHEERNARWAALITYRTRPISLHGPTELGFDLFARTVDDDPA